MCIQAHIYVHMCVNLIIWIEQVRLYLEMLTHTHTNERNWSHELARKQNGA